MGKEILKYFIVVVGVFVLIRVYDFVTKKPNPTDRTENPEITRISKRQDSIIRSTISDKRQRDSANNVFLLTMDSLKLGHKKSANEHKKIKTIPDTLLRHYRDSVRRANGLK